MNWPFIILGFAGTALIAFGAGWELSVQRHRAAAEALRTKYVGLLTEIDSLTEQVSADPVQFAMQTGRDYVINRVEQLVCTLREEDQP